MYNITLPARRNTEKASYIHVSQSLLSFDPIHQQEIVVHVRPLSSFLSFGNDFPERFEAEDGFVSSALYGLGELFVCAVKPVQHTERAEIKTKSTTSQNCLRNAYDVTIKDDVSTT